VASAAMAAASESRMTECIPHTLQARGPPESEGLAGRLGAAQAAATQASTLSSHRAGDAGNLNRDGDGRRRRERLSENS
jgi:hypothetical protein